MTDEQYRNLWQLLEECRESDGTITLENYEKVNAAYLATGEKEPMGCGYSKLWWTGPKDPFTWAACAHDLFYPDVEGYVHHHCSKDFTDYCFYRNCLDVAKAKNSNWLRMKANIYYMLVRMFKREFKRRGDDD